MGILRTCFHTGVLPSLTLALLLQFRFHSLLSLLTACEMLPSERLRAIDLDTALKATMIELCRDLSLPHNGRKAQLASQLRIRQSTLPPPVTTSSTAIIPSTTAQVSSLSPQPTLSSPRHVTTASTPSSNDTALQLSDARAAPSNPPQPQLMLAVPGSQMYLLLPCKFPPLEPRSHSHQPTKLNLGKLLFQSPLH